MIHVIQQKQLLTDKRLIELLLFKNKTQQRMAAYMKVGLGRQPVKLLMGKDYREFWRSNEAMAAWKRKQIWLPNKKIKIESTLASVSAPFDDDDTSLDEMAAAFSSKAVRGLAYARGAIEAKPLAKAKAEAAHAKHLKNKAKREKYYSSVEETGIF